MQTKDKFQALVMAMPYIQPVFYIISQAERRIGVGLGDSRNKCLLDTNIHIVPSSLKSNNAINRYIRARIKDLLTDLDKNGAL